MRSLRVSWPGMIAVLVMFFPAAANACTCVESFAPWLVEFSNSDAVFVGKVRAVIPVKRSRDGDFFGDRLVTFEITKAYKGVEPTTRLISLYSDYAATSCSFGVDDRKGPAKGESWLVLAHQTTSPQMSFGGSCNSSQKIGNKDELITIEKHAFKFREQQGIVGSVKLNYMDLAKDVEVRIVGERIDEKIKVDADGYYWFPLDLPGRYSVTASIPFRTTLIDAVYFPDSFEHVGAQTRFTYVADVKQGKYHYNEVNINMPK